MDKMDKELDELVKDSSFTRKKTRGGKSGKRQKLRELYGYMPKPKPEPKPAAKAKAKAVAATPQKRRFQLVENSETTERDAASAPSAVTGRAAASAPSGRAAANAPPVTVFSQPKVAPRTPTFGWDDDEEFTGKGTSSSSQDKSGSSKPLAPPWLRPHGEGKVLISKTHVLEPTPKSEPKARSGVLQKEEYKGLLDTAAEAKTQEERMAARRELRRKLEKDENKPKGTAGVSFVRQAPSVCSSCVVRKEKLAPKVRQYADDYLRRERMKASNLRLRSRSPTVIHHRSVSESRSRSEQNNSPRSPLVKEGTEFEPDYSPVEDVDVDEEGVFSPLDRSPRTPRSPSPTPTREAVTSRRDDRSQSEDVSAPRAPSPPKKTKKKKAQQEKKEKKEKKQKKQKKQSAEFDSDLSSFDRWPELSHVPSRRTESSRKPRLTKQNLRKDRTRTYREAATSPPTPEPAIVRAPVLPSKRLCTLDIHGVLDSDRGQFPEEAYDVMWQIYKKHNIRFAPLSFIGKKNEQLREKAKTFCRQVRDGFLERYGDTCFGAVTHITDSRCGHNGKLEKALELKARYHIDDNIGIVNEMHEHGSIRVAFQMRGHRRPAQVDRAIPCASTLVGCLQQLFGSAAGED